MKRLLVPLLVGTAFLALPGQERAIALQPGVAVPSAQAARIALVIGNAGYEGAPLRNPVNDARAMKEALEGCRFQVTLLENAGKRAMEDAIRAFGERIRGGAVGLFYYAGHGLQARGENYLVPIGARLEQEEDLPYQAVNVGLLLDRMEGAHNSLNILVLDACRNNPFAGSWHRGAGEAGLAGVNAPKGTFIAYATAPGSTAADGAGANGLYTQALLEGLREPGLELEKVFKGVSEKVLEASGRRQTPWVSYSAVGDFFFRPRRSAGEIAQDQRAVAAETARLEEELKRQQDLARQARQAEVAQAAARQAQALALQLKAQQLDQDRLAREETQRQTLLAEQARLEAEATRRQEEAARLEALKQRLAAERAAATPAGAASLAAAREEADRISRQREALVKPLQERQAQERARLEASYSALLQPLEAPRDEFETTAHHQDRLKQAAELRAKAKHEWDAVVAFYAESARQQTADLDTRLAALRSQEFSSIYPVLLGAYDADQGRYPLEVEMTPGSRYEAWVRLDPAQARTLRSRQDLLHGTGPVSLAQGAAPPRSLADPVWGLLPLLEVKPLQPLARIGSEAIFPGDFQLYLDQVMNGAQKQQLAAKPALREEAQQRYLDLRLMAAKARKDGLQDSPACKTRLKWSLNRVLAEEGFQRDRAALQAQANAAPLDARAYYDRHPEKFTTQGTRRPFAEAAPEAGRLADAERADQVLRAYQDAAGKAVAFADGPAAERIAADQHLLPGPLASGDRILAVIGRDLLLLSELESYIDSTLAEPQRKQVRSGPESMQTAADTFVRYAVFAAKARLDGLDRSPEYRRMARLREWQALADTLGQRDLSGPGQAHVSLGTLRAYYQAHPDAFKENGTLKPFPEVKEKVRAAAEAERQETARKAYLDGIRKELSYQPGPPRP